MALPQLIASMIPQKRFIGRVQGIVANTVAKQTVTFQVTAAFNYLDIYLVLANLTAAMVQQVRLKIGADTIQKWSGTDLDAYLQYDRLPASATNSILKLPLRRMGIRGGLDAISFDAKKYLSGAARVLALESSLNCGSSGGGFNSIKDVTIEMDITNTPVGQPSVAVYGRVTAPVEGGPGAVYRVDQQTKTISNGVVTITKSEMGLDALRPYMNRIVLVNNQNSDLSLATFTSFMLRYGTNDWWTLELALLQQMQTEDNLRALQAGYTILDFQEEGFGDETLDMSAPNSDILLQFTASGITDNPTLTYYICSLGLPFSPNQG